MNTRKLTLVLLGSATLAACSSYATRAAAPVTVSGDLLAGSNGMTLYTFDRDAAGSGKSVCNAGCAANWPPLLASSSDAASGDYSVIIRDDGSRQWAFKGKPLYYWAKDQKPGDKTGDGINQVWHVARP